MKVFSTFRPLLIVGVISGLMSCHVPPPKPPLVETLAVLMFDSESNNVDAPEIMQRLVYLALKASSGYRLQNISETNAKLNEFGFVDGGQLGAIDETKLGRDLGVQGLLFGNVESFGYLNVGVYVSRKVNLELKLVEVTSGETLWENSGKGITRKIALDKNEIEKNFARGLADQLADKLLDIPLENEAKLATRRALSSLPGFQFRGFAKDDQTPSHLKQNTKKAIKRAIHKK